MRLKGRVALITGAASGIGRAAALRMAGEGAAVALADVDASGGETARDAIRQAGGEAIFLQCDVACEEEVARTVGSAREQFGGLHVLVNAAGVLLGAYQPIDELELSVFERVLDVNVLGTFLFCKHAAPVIEASGGGVILCIASGAGIRGPSSSLPYGASKAEVQGLCYTLERQLAPRGIRLNVVCPGSIDSAMKRQNVRDGAAAHGEDPDQALEAARLGEPDGVAKILAFLASSDADYVLGTVFTC